MTKPELIGVVAEEHGVSKAKMKAIADTLLSELCKEVLKSKESITFRGIGTFKFSERKARTGRNPQTGAEMQIQAKKSVKFVLSKSF